MKSAGIPEARWKLIEHLFQTAADMDANASAAFLDDACGNDGELRSEVEGLLAWTDRTLSFLKKPVDEAAGELGQAVFDGQRLGAYRVIRLLGEGGMSKVYLGARADHEYQQRVAIKIMLGGPWHGEAMFRRFRAERQILANLNHPNIAHLLDAGVMPNGTPYLVMEFVDGMPIDEYCRQNKVSVEVRLKLFIQVCSAVGYAHKNLVIHRDLKPGNILVDDAGVPKLLDFGIAKLMDDAEAAELGPRTRATERLLTPEYASPEQIRAEAVTTATDVYGLGVLLYELLVGRHPFPRRAGGTHQLARDICETEPDPPSCAAFRDQKLDPVAARKLRGDLDHIVLMAIRKEPARRYSSVEQLAADVSAYLNGYPVQARTDTFAYRSWKFFQRHKAGVAAGAMALIALVCFVIAMTLLSGRARVERLKAERQATFLAEMFRAASPHVARGRVVAARDLLDEGAKRIDRELAAEPEVRASLLRSIAAAYYSLGSYEEAQQLADRSYKLRLETIGHDDAISAATMMLVGRVLISKGEYESAEPLFRHAVSVRREILKHDDPAVAESLTLLGACLSQQNKNREAEGVLQQVLPIYRRRGTNLGADTRELLAMLLERRGDYGEAARLTQESVNTTRRLHGSDSPTYATSLNNLARSLIRKGDYSAAESHLRESLAIHRKVHREHPGMISPLNNLGAVLLNTGRRADAEPVLKNALELGSRLLGSTHPYVVVALCNWADLLYAEGRFNQADTYLTELFR